MLPSQGRMNDVIVKPSCYVQGSHKWGIAKNPPALKGLDETTRVHQEREEEQHGADREKYGNSHRHPHQDPVRSAAYRVQERDETRWSHQERERPA